MLPEDLRLRASADFTEVVRRGRRASRPLLTVHALLPPPRGPVAVASVAQVPDAVTPDAMTPDAMSPARAGLVVSKAVGGSVVRHRTARRLRHLLRDRLGNLPAGTRLVVRAAPPAGTAPSAALADDLDGALASALRPRGPR